MLEPKQYPIHPRYKWFALFCLLLAALLGWNVSQDFTWEAIFFLVILLTIATWSLLLGFSHVTLTAEQITLYTPLIGTRRVALRQLISVSENGRFNRVLTLIYHPRLANNLLDLDDVRSLILPTVDGQDELLATLEVSVPL